MASKNIPPNGWPQLKDLEAVQPTLNRLDKIEAWKRTVKEETFTGEELTIPNALKLPVKSLKTTIEAIQDLHGYDHPWAGGAGKNKLPITRETPVTIANVTFTLQDDGSLKVQGTASGEIYLWFNSTDGATDILEDSTQYIASVSGIDSSLNMEFQVCERATSESGLTYLVSRTSDGSTSFTTNASPYGRDARVHIRSGSVITTPLYLKMMVRLATESDASFAPYSNICPISGRTEARVDTENEDSTESAYAVIQLGQTVYGAEINWDTGVCTVDRVLADNSLLTVFRNNTAGTGTLASFNKTTNGYASRNAYTTSIFKPQTVSQWEALDADTILTDSGTGYCVICTDVPDQTQEQLQQWLTDNGAQICLYLANPTTIQLTATQLQMLKGYNRITLADGYGTIELKALTGANWS